jgi:hypothetical protein
MLGGACCPCWLLLFQNHRRRGRKRCCARRDARGPECVGTGRKLLLEELVGNDAGLGEAVHSFPNFDVDPSFFVNQVPEVVFYDDLFRDDVELEVHVFQIGHRDVKVEVGQVDAKEHSARCAYRGVDEEFGGEEVRSGSAFVAGEVDEISTNCESSAIDLLLLQPDIADNATVGGALVFWDLCFLNEETRVCARYVADSLKQSS